MWKYIIGGIIAVVVIFLIILMFSQLLSKEGDAIGGKIDDINLDCDCDGVANILDSCPNSPKDDNVDMSGCSGADGEKLKCTDRGC